MNRVNRYFKIITATVVLILFCLYAGAQDGNAGINEANTKVRSYFDSGTNLMYAVGALLGLIGAVKVYQKGMPATRTPVKWLRPGSAVAFSWSW